MEKNTEEELRDRLPAATLFKMYNNTENFSFCPREKKPAKNILQNNNDER